MGEVWESISSFVSEGTGEAASTAQTAPVVSETPVQKAAPKNDTAKKMQEKKAPALEVIAGGKSDKDRTKTPLQKAVLGADAINLSTPDVPTPGGISFVLMLVLFLLFAVAKLPSGKTRLQVLFAAMMGRAKIGGQTMPAAVGQGSQPQIGMPGNPSGMSLHTGLGYGVLTNHGDY